MDGGLRSLVLGSNSVGGQHQFETWTMVGLGDGEEGTNEAVRGYLWDAVRNGMGALGEVGDRNCPGRNSPFREWVRG